MNCCYILFSQKLNRHYIGISHGDLDQRIQKHNFHEYGHLKYTAKASDWELLLKIDCISFAQARKIELHLKRMKSSTYIINLCRYPEMVLKLKNKYLI